MVERERLTSEIDALRIPCPSPVCDAGAGEPCRFSRSFHDQHGPGPFMHVMRLQSWERSPEAAAQFRAELADMDVVIIG